ncbi:MAG: MBL fold metallo-hydrolase, partial [Candidatus Veblenbacteria bacterium]|nr:MBL fold metallo-hydrolase [Candidatus Veblenbacteria bacterium]
IAPNARIKLYNAGHILGSSVIVMETEEQGRTSRVAFTGDLGRTGTPLLPDPEYIKDEAEVLLMESTYGNRIHQPILQAVERLVELVKVVQARGGKIIVPTFALGRTQELIYVLHQLTDQGRIPRLPIYVDSPLATNLTEVFTRHPETYDEEAWEDFGKRGDLPLAFRNLTYTVSRDESKALNSKPGPFMVLSASGMCEAGRILHHLINGVEDERNLILITGFQAQHTLGRRLVEGEKRIRIFGSYFQVKAGVEVLNEFSAHADAPALQDYAEHINGLKQVFLVHGEPSQAEALQQRLAAAHPTWSVTVPKLGESFEITTS